MVSLLGDAFVPGEEKVFQGVYRCQGEDGWCAITVATDEEWANFKKALGSPLWAEDRRFATLANRLKNKRALDEFIENWTKVHPAEEVTALLQKKGVAAGVVQSAADLAGDPQLKERGFFVELDHPEMGKTISDASPVRLSASPPQYRHPAPLPGQDNGYVYGELLGLSKDEVNKLRKQGVI
jgi:crotonobetainyl-CoA:carnitine CoA-transferase CaiB-like acyl-CoA transferase